MRRRRSMRKHYSADEQKSKVPITSAICTETKYPSQEKSETLQFYLFLFFVGCTARAGIVLFSEMPFVYNDSEQ
jgi:hypothetical protein